MIPLHIETIYRKIPWANSGMIVACVLGSLVDQIGLSSTPTALPFMALGSDNPMALFAHAFVQHSPIQLAGNLVFLWVLGNALCGMLGNAAFSALFVALAMLSGLPQLAIGHVAVVGANGTIAGLLGMNLAFFPRNSVTLYYPGLRTFESKSAPVWVLSFYWIAWVIAGGAFGFAPFFLWGQIAGLFAGLTLGLVFLKMELVEFCEYDAGSLLDLLPRKAEAELDDPLAAKRAEIQQLARLYQEEYSALPEITVGIPKIPQPRLTLRRSMGFAQHSHAPGTPGPEKNPATTRAYAWPAHLPDGAYFYFDGRLRHGPVTRAAFISALSQSPDTEKWLYWFEGMHEWQQVGTLPAEQDPMPQIGRRYALSPTGT